MSNMQHKKPMPMAKTSTITTALKLGITLMLTDIDMIWHHNPSPYFLYRPDVVETQCHQCLPADNLGIVFAAPGTESIIKVWDDEKAMITNDNDAFRQSMTREQKKSGKAMTRCLPRFMYGFSMDAPGAGPDTHDWLDGVPHTRLVTHYVATQDKIKDMEAAGHWKYTLYGRDQCTLVSGLFSCSNC